jgi:amino acid transporter
MGEMCVWLPIDGSFVVFAHAFLDDAWGFSLGWLYTVTNSLSAAGEVAAVAAIVNFWTDAVNNGKLSLAMLLSYPTLRARKGHQHETRTDPALAVYVAVISSSLLALNIFGVRIYGEGEFYFSLFKIFLIMGLLVMTCRFSTFQPCQRSEQGSTSQRRLTHLNQLSSWWEAILKETRSDFDTGRTQDFSTNTWPMVAGVSV